jgi:4-amino-4-deoxy-L-arabinose transferase-like glycosyltransferase
MAVVLAAIFSINYLRKAGGPAVDFDEGAWIFSSYYYSLAFDRFELSSPEWKDFDAFDQPPLAKYIIGYALSLAGERVATLDLKRWWHRNDWDMAGRGEFGTTMQQLIGTRALRIGRAFSSLSFLAAAWLLFLTLRRSCSLLVAVSASLMFALSPPVLNVAGLTLADGLLLAFMMAAVLLQDIWVERTEKGRETLGLSVAIGAVCAGAFLTKLNGALSLAAAAILCLLVLLRAARGRAGDARRVLRDAVVMAGSFLALAYLLNPAFYSTPLESLRLMVRCRTETLSMQAAIFHREALPTLALRAAYFIRKMFFEFDWAYRLLHVSACLILCLAALMRLPRVLKEEDLRPVALWVNGAVWGGVTFFNYSMNWERYLLPALPFMLLVAAVGLETVLKMVPELRRPTGRAAAAAAFILAMYVGCDVMRRRVTIEAAYEACPRCQAKAELRQANLLHELYPEQPAYTQRLKELQSSR